MQIILKKLFRQIFRGYRQVVFRHAPSPTGRVLRRFALSISADAIFPPKVRSHCPAYGNYFGKSIFGINPSFAQTYLAAPYEHVSAK